MHFRPHNHEMWACIGIFGGQEDNTFYRRAGGGLVESGGRSLATGDVALMGDDTIHAVTNPLAASAGTIHIYGGKSSPARTAANGSNRRSSGTQPRLQDLLRDQIRRHAPGERDRGPRCGMIMA
jgi:predicted metal-dependent enzyme (double-stranded beta helix superfamily)